jgi:hypothetical protein
VKQSLKQAIKKTRLYRPLRDWAEKGRHKRELMKWYRNGTPAPPPHIVKQRTLRRFADRFGLMILVETGTYLGDMVEAMKGAFDQIYSIELSDELYDNAKDRFKDEKNVELIHGDSGTELGKLMHRIDRPALFWLDAHYSAGVTAKGDEDTAIYGELTHIFGAEYRGHVIVIDDARCFGTNPGYPSIEELSKFIKSKSSNVSITIEEDSIRITPNKVIA